MAAQAAYHRQGRPARYRIAAGLVGVVLLVLAVTAVFDYRSFADVPGRALLFGLPVVVFIGLRPTSASRPSTGTRGGGAGTCSWPVACSRRRSCSGC